MTAPDVGVAIVSYRVPDLLMRCLESLQCSASAGRLRVCVVDCASCDDTVERVSARFPAVLCVPLSENVGYVRGNNIAVRQLRETPGLRYILFLNPDTVVPAEAIERLVADLERFPHVGIVGPRLYLTDGSIDWACRRGFPTPLTSLWHLIGLGSWLPQSRVFGRYRLTYLDERAVADVDALAGACMLVRADVLDEVGLFDESFFMYGEDIDLCRRVRNRGWRILYDGTIDVHHRKRASSEQNPRARHEFVRAMEIYYAKHHASSTHPLIDRLVTVGLRVYSAIQRIRSSSAVGTA